MSKESGDGWVFWSREKDDEEYKSGNGISGDAYCRFIRENIRRALIRVMCCGQSGNSSQFCAPEEVASGNAPEEAGIGYIGMLVQFWAPKEVGGRSILTTLHQPFAINCFPEKGISWYRKKCMEHHYIVDDGAEKEQLGPPGRVFQNGRPESGFHSGSGLWLYYKKEFPLQGYADCCGLSGYLVLPVFDLVHSQCLGVLEFNGQRYANLSSVGSLSYIFKALKVLNMRTTHMLDTEPQKLLESATYYLRREPDMLELFLNDERHLVSESRENPQKPGTDHTKNVEEQEQNTIDTNSIKANKRDESKTSFPIIYEDLELHFGKRLKDAANELAVNRSTLKRAHKDYSIKRWPSNVKNKKNPSRFQTKTSHKPVQNFNQQISRPSSSSLSVSDFLNNSNVARICIDNTREVDKTCQETTVVTIKAKFKENIIKFDLCLSLGLEKLVEEVAKSLNLRIGNFKLKYEDDDDDLILLTCDEDLHYYVNSMRSPGKTTIRVLVSE